MTKSIIVTIQYTVKMNIGEGVPKVLQQLEKIEGLGYAIDIGDQDIYSEAIDWVGRNAREHDATSWEFEVDEINDI